MARTKKGQSARGIYTQDNVQSEVEGNQIRRGKSLGGNGSFPVQGNSNMPVQADSTQDCFTAAGMIAIAAAG